MSKDDLNNPFADATAHDKVGTCGGSLAKGLDINLTASKLEVPGAGRRHGHSPRFDSTTAVPPASPLWKSFRNGQQLRLGEQQPRQR